jgi:hypothetical protein
VRDGLDELVKDAALGVAAGQSRHVPPPRRAWGHLHGLNAISLARTLAIMTSAIVVWAPPVPQLVPQPG